MAAEFNTFAQALGNPASNGSSYFPANPFRIRPIAHTADMQSQNPAPDDRSERLSSYAIEAVEQPDGHSVDIVRFLRDHRVLDLTALIEKTPVTHIPAIGGFDLGGRQNTLKLSLVDVLSLGETDLFISDGKLQLMVSGNTGDSIDLASSHIAGLTDGEWRPQETAQVAGVTYTVVGHSSANVELLVGTAVRIDMH